MERSWGEQEFMGSGVEDKREARSLSAMGDRLLSHPEHSFSGACGPALRKAAWRIFSKPEVAVNYGHYQQTSLRCQAQGIVLVSQDTTDLSYPTHPCTEGLGDLGGPHNKGGHPGLCLHSALALSESGFPLGLVGQKVWAPLAQGRPKHASQYPLEEKESYRWVEGLQWVDHYLAKVSQVVVVSERESDFYDYVTAPRGGNVALLFRAHHLHRWVYQQGHRLRLGEVHFAEQGSLQVELPKTKTRAKRTADLALSWGTLECPAPVNHQEGERVSLQLVRAKEKNTTLPDAIDWYLLTTLPVNNQQDACRMLAYYRKRWVIERWHLVLKEGGKVELLQFDRFQRLSNALQLLSVVAWQLLVLKHLAGEYPQTPVEAVFEPLQVQLLEAQSGKKQLTIQQACLIIAALAGFVATKKQPLPGEKTMWRGWAIFTACCKGAQLISQKSYGTG